MSYNGSGTFLINTAGQPVVSGTVISSTAFNALTADLATGLSTAITKDGQTTITANIPMANYKFTGLGVGSAAGDSANLSQVQSTAVKLLASVSGADTITAVGSPNVAAYVAGQMFYFVAAAANTGAVTINIDSLGAKSITRDGTTALAAGDIQSGEVCVIVYDGTQFQLVNGASQSASIVTENLTVNKATVLNESGGDNDTRIEGDTDANLFFVDASTDRIGVGTSSPSTKLHAAIASGTAYTTSSDGNVLTLSNSTASGYAGIAFNTEPSAGNAGIAAINSFSPSSGNSVLTFSTRTSATLSEKLRLDESGNVGIGTSSPQRKLHVEVSSGTAVVRAESTATNGEAQFEVYGKNSGGTARTAIFKYDNSDKIRLGTASAIPLAFETSDTERARITAGGDLLINKTSDTGNGVGITLGGTGYARLVRSGAELIVANRLASDGTLIFFERDQVAEGSISVSGNTVSYNAFAGSHWSQLQDGSKPDILRGTVMESINELCVWPGEQNERLPKAKISDTAGSKKVYGVFMAWDNDWTETNDMYVTAVGAFICRVNANVTVQEGDLLESNGDGTARVQADDIIRSSTIGKVTSTVKTHEYDDGSYCVPTVLYCG